MCRLVVVNGLPDREGGHSNVPSPTKVPAATIAKPIHRPQTTPQSKATISWPNNGGKEMTKRIAMGMSQPAGRSRSFSEKGRSFSTTSSWWMVM